MRKNVTAEKLKLSHHTSAKEDLYVYGKEHCDLGNDQKNIEDAERSRKQRICGDVQFDK